MGAFAVRFPGANVLTLVPIVLYTIAHLPAWIFMLIYLGEQVFMSVVHSEQNGGVAWWAHIGGFAAGYILIRVFPVTPQWKEIFRRLEERRHAT
jgi:membrane associated rhomboid family serine protease